MKNTIDHPCIRPSHLFPVTQSTSQNSRSLEIPRARWPSSYTVVLVMVAVLSTGASLIRRRLFDPEAFFEGATSDPQRWWFGCPFFWPAFRWLRLLTWKPKGAERFRWHVGLNLSSKALRELTNDSSASCGFLWSLGASMRLLPTDC